MDDIIEAGIELVGDILETALMHIKDPKKRKWALTVFYSVVTLAVVGFLTWLVVALQTEGNSIGAVVIAGVALFLLILFGFFIIRGHRRNWRNKKDN